MATVKDRRKTRMALSPPVGKIIRRGLNGAAVRKNVVSATEADKDKKKDRRLPIIVATLTAITGIAVAVINGSFNFLIEKAKHIDVRPSPPETSSASPSPRPSRIPSAAPSAIQSAGPAHLPNSASPGIVSTGPVTAVPPPRQPPPPGISAGTQTFAITAPDPARPVSRSVTASGTWNPAPGEDVWTYVKTTGNRYYFGNACLPATEYSNGTWVGSDLNVGAGGSADIGLHFPITAILVDAGYSAALRKACQAAHDSGATANAIPTNVLGKVQIIVQRG